MRATRPAAALALLLLLPALAAASPPTVRDVIRAASVTVRTDKGCGSGTLFQTKAGELYVLTAAHVTDGADEVKCCQYRDRDGAHSSTWCYAEVYRSSTAEDLCLLRLPKGAFGKPGVTMHAAQNPPPADIAVLHCGTFQGFCHHSVARGEITAVGREWDGKCKEKDQLDVTAYPGSSGGGVFTEQGEFVGVLTHGLPGGRCCWMAPARRVRAWAKAEGAGFVFGGGK